MSQAAVVPAPRQGLSRFQVVLAVALCALVATVELKVFTGYFATIATAASYEQSGYVDTNLANVQRETLRLQTDTIEALYAPDGDFSRVELRRAFLAKQLSVLEIQVNSSQALTRRAPFDEYVKTLTHYDELLSALQGTPPGERADLGRQLRETAGQLELGIKTLAVGEHRGFFGSMSAGLNAQRQTQMLLAALGALIPIVGGGLVFSLWRSIVKEFRHAHARLTAEMAERSHAEAEVLETNGRLTTALVQLGDAQAHLVQQERLRALGQMASGIAHDLNNALAPVVGFSELLRSVPGVLDDRERTHQYLDLILTGANDAADTVRRLREFYRRPTEGAASDFVTLSLSDLTQQVVALTEPKWRNEAQAAGRTVTIQTELGAGIWVHGNEAGLREALTNVLFNAVDAMPYGGPITLRTRLENGSTAVVEVCDAGAGMSPETRRRCMEPFFTTKGERGSGLGLSMVHGIVQRHNGTVEIESWQGRGTTIALRFPAVYEASPEKAATPTMATPTKHPPKRILMVDDEEPVRRTVVAMLLADGHTVEAFETGHAALAALRAHAFDLVITDRAMPGLGGEEVARQAKALLPDMPVIMLTGFGDFMNANDERPPHVDHVLSKPPSLRALREALTGGSAAHAPSTHVLAASSS
jgi:signal transduction histidine kinase/ActR/RegA family two-component response regulator